MSEECFVRGDNVRPRIDCREHERAGGLDSSHEFDHDVGFAHEFLENNAFVLELTNRLPWGRKLGLDAILARRMNGRAGYFEQNMRRGVFDSVQKTLRAYPGFKVNAA